MNKLLRCSLLFVLFTFAHSAWAICDRPEQENNPFCQEKQEFDQDTEEKRDILALSQAINDEVTVIKNHVDSTSGNVLANDWACSVRPCTQSVSAAGLSTAFLVSSQNGKYGTLYFDSSGAYTYVLDTASQIVKDLKDGDLVSEMFEYDMVEPWYYVAYRAKLIVHIHGDSGELPASVQAIKDGIVALPDEGTVIKNAVLTYSGNALTNDSGALTAYLLSSPSSPYGNLTWNDSGQFTYTVFNDLPEVQSLGVGETIVDRFNYMIVGQFGFTSVSTITITILGNNAALTPEEQAIKDNVFAMHDEGTVVKNVTLEFSGNALANDSGALTAYLDSPPIGRYGNLEFDSAGNFNYSLFNESSAVQSLREGEFLVDEFEYVIEGLHGYRSKTTITIYILGSIFDLPPEEQALKDAVVARNDENTVIKDTLLVATGNVTDNDSGAKTATLIDGPVGNYGSLEFNSDGTYKYTLTNPPAASTGFVFDVFPYSIEGEGGYTSEAELKIWVLLQPITPEEQQALIESIYALDDENTVIRETKVSTSGNVGENDGPGVQTFLLGDGVNPGNPTGTFGSLDFNSNGDYTYTLYAESAQPADFCSAAYETDKFDYHVKGVAGLTSDNATATLTIYILCDPNADEQSEQAIRDGIVARPDEATVVRNETASSDVSGKALANDSGAISAYLSNDLGEYEAGLGIAQYGNFEFNSDGSFTYILANNLPIVKNLPQGESLEEVFYYSIIGEHGYTATSTITIRIFGSLQDIVDNSELEPNDVPAQATALTTTKLMKGQMLNPSDQDWFNIPLEANEVMHIELCPQGSTCANEKSWVLYVFNNPPGAYNPTYPIRTYRDDTGVDVAGSPVLSNHLYLNYRKGNLTNLIGIIDPCFGDNNAIDVEVEAAADIYVAISTPLLGDESTVQCGQGDVVLTRAGEPDGLDPIGDATTEEYLLAFPFSDDDYTLSVTKGGATANAIVSDSAASYNPATNIVDIPKLRVDDKLYEVQLQLQQPAAKKGALGGRILALVKAKRLPDGLRGDPNLASFNRDNFQAHLPLVVHSGNGKQYDVWLLLHPAKNGHPRYLELLKIAPRQ